MRSSAIKAKNQLRVRVLVAGTRGALHAVESWSDGREVRERELELDYLAVAHWIDGRHHERDVRIVAAADNLYNRVSFADMRKELVAQPFTLRGAQSYYSKREQRSQVKGQSNPR